MPDTRRWHRLLRRLCADRRGVSAVEFAIIAPVLFGLFLPITDIGTAALNYLTAYQALRSAGAYGQYNPPQDITNLSTGNWQSTVQGMFTGSSKSATVLCGDPGAACTAAASPFPRYLSLSTQISPNPNPLIVSFPAVTISYSERLQ